MYTVRLEKVIREFKSRMAAIREARSLSEERHQQVTVQDERRREFLVYVAGSLEQYTYNSN